MSILTLSLGAALLGAAPGAAPLVQPVALELAAQDVQTRVQALVESYNEAQREFYTRLQAVPDAAEQGRILSQENPLPAFIEPFRELAFEAAGSEAGVTAWIWVTNLACEHDRGEQAREALEILVSEHVGSDQLGEVAANLRYQGRALGEDTAREALRRIRAGSPHKPIQAAAQYSLAGLLMASTADADKAEGRKLFEGLCADFASVEGGWAARAKGMLFELDRLQIGMLAPDFSAVDQDGVAWKLSDYRGKVVVVDFWGLW